MVLFETHVKGLTQLHPEVEDKLKGRYLGLASPKMLAFYEQQNINTLQLLPVAACMHEPHLLEIVTYYRYMKWKLNCPYMFYALLKFICFRFLMTLLSAG